jgi:hypothetical protein
MELKSYEKPWLPAFKGAFLIIIGIIALLQIKGSANSLGILFTFLIGAMAVLLIGSGVLIKTAKFRGWTIIMGVINLAFSLTLLFKLNSPDRNPMLWLIFAWLVFYALTEIMEAGILIKQKNAFAALFILNAILTFLFSYFYYLMMNNFTPKSLNLIGLIAIAFGMVNILSSYLLSKK